MPDVASGDPGYNLRMPLTAVTIRGYRSVRNLYLPVEACSVFVGANGVGKTNLYKALGLLRAAADGTITRAIAEEGGVESVLWAGTRRRGQPVRLILKAHFDEMDYDAEVGLPHSYEVEIGLPQRSEAAFEIEPLVKEERLVIRHGQRDVVMMERKGSFVALRNEAGRREMLDWRLYHDFRTDAGSPIRQPCHAITTPTLSPDGRDLAAVLATLFVIREDTVDLAAAVDDAFPGARLSAFAEGSWCRFEMRFPDMPRPFAMQELSDGTLKYLCLLGALMGYRLPSLIALNEPEASLHPALLAPLARLIGRSAGRARIWIVTHSEALADAMREETGKPARRVIKSEGTTAIEGLKLTGEYRDDEPEHDEA